MAKTADSETHIASIDPTALETITGGRFLWAGAGRGQNFGGFFPRLNGSFARGMAGGQGGGQGGCPGGNCG